MLKILTVFKFGLILTVLITNTKGFMMIDDMYIRYIDALFFCNGFARPKDLIERFGMNRTKASNLFSKYRDEMKASVIFEVSSKTYVAASDFEPAFDWLKPEANEFLFCVNTVFDKVGLVELKG
ncbi:hypothetical protein ACCE85_003957 [Photobacterium damselae]